MDDHHSSAGLKPVQEECDSYYVPIEGSKLFIVSTELQFYSSLEAKGTLKSVLESGKIRIGHAPRKPVNWVLNGTQVGFEYDLGNEIVRTIGQHYGIDLQLQWISIQIESFFESLSQVQFRAICFLLLSSSLDSTVT